VPAVGAVAETVVVVGLGLPATKERYMMKAQMTTKPPLFLGAISYCNSVSPGFTTFNPLKHPASVIAAQAGHQVSLMESLSHAQTIFRRQYHQITRFLAHWLDFA
jgi:hypothetical protein